MQHRLSTQHGPPHSLLQANLLQRHDPLSDEVVGLVDDSVRALADLLYLLVGGEGHGGGGAEEGRREEGAQDFPP